MKWHLCTPEGTSARVVLADSLPDAQRLCRPIAHGWFVVSDASYRIPRVVTASPASAPAGTCAECHQQPRVVGRSRCHGCASAANPAYRRKVTRTLDPLTPAQRKERASSAAVEAWVRRREDKEKFEAFRLASSVAMKAIRARAQVYFRSEQAAIARGIEHRKAKRLAAGANAQAIIVVSP